MSPLVVAHRGSSGEFPEHTRAAYLDAIAGGAEALECDVRLTVDGHLVCLHDATLDRTTDGHGPLSTRTLAQLQSVDAVSWKAVPGLAREGVLPFAELLDLVVLAGRPLTLCVETKHPTRRSLETEAAVMQALAARGFASDGSHPSGSSAVLMSFSFKALRRARSLSADLRLLWLVEDPDRVRAGVPLPTGIAAVGPSMTMVRADRELVARAHDQGLQVNVWTVNDPDDVRRCVDLGVDLITTNFPRRILSLLGR